MKDIRKIHGEAMEFARKAETCLGLGDSVSYALNTKKAFDLEKEAALELKEKYDAEPTRSVLFRSAASLAHNIGFFDESKQLIEFALKGKPNVEIETELKELELKVTSSLAEQNSTSENDQQTDTQQLIETIDLDLKKETKLPDLLTEMRDIYSKVIISKVSGNKLSDKNIKLKKSSLSFSIKGHSPKENVVNTIDLSLFLTKSMNTTLRNVVKLVIIIEKINNDKSGKLSAHLNHELIQALDENPQLLIDLEATYPQISESEVRL